MRIFKSKAEKEQERAERQRKYEQELAQNYEIIKNNNNANVILSYLLNEFSDPNGERNKNIKNGIKYEVHITFNAFKITSIDTREDWITYSSLGLDDLPSKYIDALSKYLFDELSKINHIKIIKGDVFVAFYITSGEKSSW